MRRDGYRVEIVVNGMVSLELRRLEFSTWEDQATLYDYSWQRTGKPVERQGRKVTDLEGTGS